MKQKTEKTKNAYSDSKNEIRVENSIQTNKMDEAYLQINQTSFQQNFKFLIAHYKANGQASQVNEPAVSP